MSRFWRDMPLLSLSNAALSSLKVSDSTRSSIELACDLVRSFAERVRDGDEKTLEQRGAVVEGHARLDLVPHHPRGIERMIPRGDQELRP
jgi:hypothetical protein